MNGGGAPPVVPGAGIESHYLPFDALVDYAYADAVFGGITGDYTIAIKVATKITTGSTAFSTAYYFASGGAGSSELAQGSRDSVGASGATWGSTVFMGFSESAATTYSHTTALPGDTASRVFAVKRDSTAEDAFMRICNGAGVEASSDDTSATHQKPDHICVGTRISNALSPASRYGDVAFIGLVIASALIPDAELTAWLNATTAIGNITGIDHYWCATDITGTTIPPSVGTVSLTLSGPTSSDLVAWSP